MRTLLLLPVLAATLLLSAAHDDYDSTCSAPLYERINNKFHPHISGSDENTLPLDNYTCRAFVRALGSLGKEFGVTADVCIPSPNNSLVDDISARIFDKLDSRYFNITSIRNLVAYSIAGNSTHIENYLFTIEKTQNEQKDNDTVVNIVYTVLYPSRLFFSVLAFVVNALALICLVTSRHLNKSRKVILIILVIACLLTATFETWHLTLKLDHDDLIVFCSRTTCVFITVVTVLILSVDMNLCLFRPLGYQSNSGCRAAIYTVTILLSASTLCAVLIAAANHNHKLASLLIISFIVVYMFFTALFKFVVFIKINVWSKNQVRNARLMNDVRLSDRYTARTQRFNIFFLVVAVLKVLLFSPYCVYEIFPFTDAILYRSCVALSTIRRIIGIVTDFFLVLNCCLNPLCYILCLSDIRKSFWLALQRCCPSTTVKTSDNLELAVVGIKRAVYHQSLASNGSTGSSRRRNLSKDARKKALKQPCEKPKNDNTARDSGYGEHLLQSSGDAVSISAPQQQLPRNRPSTVNPLRTATRFRRSIWLKCHYLVPN